MSEFKKEAQDFWPPGVPRPKSSTEAPATSSVPAPPKTDSGALMPPALPGTVPAKRVTSPPATFIKNMAVQNMQRAIQDLSRSIANEQIDTKTKAVVSVNKNFNDFIGHHYVQPATPSTKPSPDEPVEPATIQAQTSVQSVMQHLSGLDNIKNFRPNGVWSPKTNEALENIYKLAYSMLQVAGDFGLLDNSIYNNTYLGGFKNKLSGYTFDKNKISLKADEQEQRASSIIKHIHAIERFYNHLKREISSRPNLRSHIEEKKPFESYTSTGLNLTPEEDQYAKTDTAISTMPYAAPKLPGKRLNYIPIKSLRSKKDYLDWMMGYAGVENESEAIGIFNSFIKPKLEVK